MILPKGNSILDLKFWILDWNLNSFLTAKCSTMFIFHSIEKITSNPCHVLLPAFLRKLLYITTENNPKPQKVAPQYRNVLKIQNPKFK
ncbi:MAG: hypothetical protein AAFV71_23970 [Cyanobacteria bacterium J06633_8]